MVKSRMTDAGIPEIPIHQLVFSMIGMYEDRTCCIDAMTGRSYTFAELLDKSRRVASGLVKQGLKKGDVVAFLAPNSIDFIVMYYGTIAAGGIITPINPAYTAYEVSRQMVDSGAKFAYTIERLLDTVKEASKRCPKMNKIIAYEKHHGMITFDSLVSDNCDAYPEDLEFDVKEDVALLPYSSGTTGMPKGVMITHYNVVANLMQIGHPDQQDPDVTPESDDPTRTVIGMAPFYHAYGLIVMCVIIVAGGRRLIVLPKFIPKVFLGAIEKYKIRVLPLSPPLVLFLAKSPLVKNYDLSSVRNITCGAAPLAPETEAQTVAKLNINVVNQGYGMTETTVAAITSTREGYKSGSVGHPLANTEVEVRDVESDKPLGTNERGEICIRGPQVMKGYLNRAQETRHAIDKNGWLHTGDIGYYDEDEQFYIVDRIKELIKVKGLQVAPAELESILLGHPDIVDAAVTAIPDERSGEVPRAYVVRRKGAKLSALAVKEYVQGLVSRHKWLEGGVFFKEEIPKSENGKILRRVLKHEALKQLKSKM